MDEIDNSGQARSLLDLYGGEEVEILIDSSLGRRLYSDFEHEEMLIITATIKNAHGDMLVIDTNAMVKGTPIPCELVINAWKIKAVIRKSEAVRLVDALNLRQQKQKVKK